MKFLSKQGIATKSKQEQINELKEKFMEDLSELGVEIRKCSHCGKLMSAGYLVTDSEYYCTEKCMNNTISKEEFLELYYTGDAYWTTWESKAIV